jgi:hypothetical protein
MRDDGLVPCVEADMRTFAATAAALGATVAAASAQPAQRCSHDVFPIGGQPVAVTACASPQGTGALIEQTFKGAAGSFTRSASIDVLAGASIVRQVEDVPLTPLGLRYTLHLTLAYRAGRVAVEHAILLPGARPLK